MPGVHSEHVSPLAPVEPALHVQADCVVLATDASERVGHCTHINDSFAPSDAENVPFLQSVHVPGPLMFLYLPATHCEHVPPSGPEKPGTHEQFTLPLTEPVLNGHGKQCVVLSSSKRFEYVLG